MVLSIAETAPRCLAPTSAKAFLAQCTRHLCDVAACDPPRGGAQALVVARDHQLRAAHSWTPWPRSARPRRKPVQTTSARAAQAELGRRVDQRGAAEASGETPVVVDLAASVPDAKRNGERRAIHRRPYRRVKPIPKRPSMLDPHQAEIEAWLEAQPEMTAVDVLARLKERHSERLADVHLRTTQRLVKAWRAEQAKRMIRLGATAPTLPPGPRSGGSAAA